MIDTNYIYAPSVAEEFKCRIPMTGTKQLFLINGGIQGTKKPFSLKVEKGKSLGEILQLISVRTENSPLEISYENHFLFEENSNGKLLLCSHTFSLDSFITNETINITLEKGASTDIVLLQNEHNGAEHNANINIQMAEGSFLKIVFLTLHGGIIKNDISVFLNGERAECDLSGLYLVDGEQQVKTNISLNHNSPNCKSSQLFKGILDDSSIARFSGTINVIPNAQKTEALQANHNLVLSSGAKIYTEPHLKIYADDVKCSHGATIGRLDETELFYMRSRGISAKEAKILQETAFAYSVLEKISTTELKDRMISLTDKRLRGEFLNCKNCSKNCC